MITSCTTNAGRLALLKGEVKPDHVFKIALFTSKADLNKSTKTYKPENEVVGQGYSAKTLATPAYGVNEADEAYLDFPATLVWPNATIAADGCMIYDETLGNLALAVVSFGSTISCTNDSFTLTPETATIRFA